MTRYLSFEGRQIKRTRSFWLLYAYILHIVYMRLFDILVLVFSVFELFEF
jgi:hypothetical protein